MGSRSTYSEARPGIEPVLQLTPRMLQRHSCSNINVYSVSVLIMVRNAYAKFVARTVLVKNGQVDDAMKLLNR